VNLLEATLLSTWLSVVVVAVAPTWAVEVELVATLQVQLRLQQLLTLLLSVVVALSITLVSETAEVLKVEVLHLLEVA
jgi:hypothetical protein